MQREPTTTRQPLSSPPTTPLLSPNNEHINARNILDDFLLIDAVACDLFVMQEKNVSLEPMVLKDWVGNPWKKKEKTSRTHFKHWEIRRA